MIKKPSEILNRPLIPHLSFVFGRGISVGVITGLVVSIFRWVIDQGMRAIYHLYPIMATHHSLLIPYIFLMVIICLGGQFFGASSSVA